MTDTFRKDKGVLTEWQKQQVVKVKEKAEELHKIINCVEWGNPSDSELNGKKFKIEVPTNQDHMRVDIRCNSKAQDRLEETVMWAVKSFTKTD